MPREPTRSPAHLADQFKEVTFRILRQEFPQKQCRLRLNQAFAESRIPASEPKTDQFGNLQEKLFAKYVLMYSSG
jgi:hypothetical protein